MSSDFDKQKMLENVKRQSKRFANLLNLPLTQAQYLLARHIYLENSLSDIKNKIARGSYSGRIFLAAVAADAQADVVSSFAREFGELLTSVQNSPILGLYTGSARDLLFRTFEISQELLEKHN